MSQKNIECENWFNLNNHWSKVKGVIHLDVYQNDDKWIWKLRLNNAGIDYSLLEKGSALTLNEAIKMCDEAYIIHHLKLFQKY